MNQILIYKENNNQMQIEVRFDEETVWLSLNQISELFEKDKSVISRHLKNIFHDKELDKSSTVAKNATVQKEAGRVVKREIEFYNLDVIIAVGYRVNSKKGTQFRQWATQRLREYLVKGVAINQKRLEQLQQTIKLIGKNFIFLGTANYNLEYLKVLNITYAETNKNYPSPHFAHIHGEVISTLGLFAGFDYFVCLNRGNIPSRVTRMDWILGFKFVL